MSKRSFLSPMALSATMILGTQVQAAVLIEPLDPMSTGVSEAGAAPASLGYGEVLDRSQGADVLMAYHTSHSSHASHGSHCSGYSYC